MSWIMFPSSFPEMVAERVCRYGFMNHGSDSRYTNSTVEFEEGLFRTAWMPPRSCPCPVREREAYTGGGVSRRLVEGLSSGRTMSKSRFSMSKLGSLLPTRYE